MILNVQFSDSTDAVIVSYFGCPQDAAVFPNQGIVNTDDAKWSVFYGEVPESMQSGLPVPTAS